MSYAAYDMLHLQLNRILVAQLILLVVTIQICPLASILLIIMLLLLNAAKNPSALISPIGHSFCDTSQWKMFHKLNYGRLKLAGL